MRRFALTFCVTVLCGAGAAAAEVALRQHAIDQPWGAAVIQVADFDGDKDCDFIAITETGLSLVENTDRGKRFVLHEIEATVAPANVAIPADLDGDGDLDLVTHARFWGGDVDWNENQGKGKSWPKHRLLSSDVGSEVTALSLADADGDRDLDLVFAGTGAKWLANQDGTAKKWDSPGAIGDISSSIIVFVLADFDGDHDNDAVASDEDNREFFFAENAGKSWSGRRVLQKVDHPAFLPSYAQAIDFDKDDDLDVFAVSQTGEIVLYENQDGKGQLAPKTLAKIDGLVLARPADLDGDGDDDIVTACNVASDGVRWLENNGGNFGTQHDVFRDWEQPSLLEAADFDGDGDIDIISVSNDIDGKQTAWWENIDR